MSRTVLLSPAKLNLFLKVQNKRPDGYHNIVTVFERINLMDEISLQSIPHPTIRILCDHPDVPVGPKNLVYKAAKLLRDELGIEQGVEMHIHKRIPVAAGLAGGSSNAAVALLGLNQIWKLSLTKSELLSYAKRIGSDVAFFLYDTNWALGTERGDQIEKLNIKTKLWHILVVPHIKMYSWKVYGGLKPRLVHSDLISKGPLILERKSSQRRKWGCTNLLTKINDDANILIHNLKKDNILEVGRSLTNDLEAEVIRLCPRLKKLQERLKSLNTKGVMVSGSGPCVFGLTETEKEAEFIKSILSKRFSRVFVVSTF